MTYQDDALVGELTKSLIENGDTVFQIHRLAPTQEEHVKYLSYFFDLRGHILDAGCGIGSVASMMKQLNPSLDFTLLNISKSQLDLCPDEFKKLHCGFEKIECDSDKFDAVMFNYSIGHGNLVKTALEANRVLKSGGILAIYDMYSDNPDKLKKALDYRVCGMQEMIYSITECGFVEDTIFEPMVTYLDHFYDKMDKDTFNEVFADVKPILMTFRKT